ncbi:hypothetical protein GJU40_03510 [Bacillus lacus]|uniref:Uncharacterized protein n=1 Tax=Metabacillus lacus TaxID=1983721 RepID=A0A7X2LZ22_9BACI|nr:hypothetical protein [Metabacillus lacus]MRX71239.1 hypothetical protein [Metabacillus lacus]
MKIKINDRSIELFHGATLKHALLKTDENLYRLVRDGKASIKDQEGNITDINGAAGSGFSYYVVNN